MKTYFAQDPIFEQSKIVSSIYPDDLRGVLNTQLKDKIAFDQIEEDLSSLAMPDYEQLMQLAVAHSDGLILAGEDFPATVTKAIAASNKPVMSFQDSPAEDAYVNFFNTNFL